MTRNLITRLEKLESAGDEGGKVIVIRCEDGGTDEGAVAFFKEKTGSPIVEKDYLMVERPHEAAVLRVATEQLQPRYEVLKIYDGRAYWDEVFRVAGNTSRGLPNREARSDPERPSLTIVHHAHLLG